jgi:hypothetical protein
MAIVTLSPGHNPAAVAHFAGSARGKNVLFRQETLELQVEDVTQPALDAALVDYAANQATRDADFQDILDDIANDLAKDEFDDDSIVTAIIKEMVDQLNDIRAQTGQPALNFGQVNADIRNRIGQP